MPSETTVLAVVAALADIERRADAAGWDALPELLGLFDQPTLGDRRVLDIDELPIDPSVWRLHHQTVPGMRVPYWVGLQAITDELTTPLGPRRLRHWLRHGDRRFVGLAFLCEGLDTQRKSETGPDRLDPSPVEVRALTACDIDGRFYQIQRARGATPAITVLPDPPLPVRATVIPAALYRMVAAFAA